MPEGMPVSFVETPKLLINVVRAAGVIAPRWPRRYAATPATWGVACVIPRELERKGYELIWQVTNHGSSRDIVSGSGRTNPCGDDVLTRSEDV